MKQSLLILLALIIAGSCSYGQTSNTVFVQDSVTRLYNSTAYAANDVVTDSLSKLFIFNDVVTTKGFGGIINTAIMTIDANNTTNASFKLLIFSDTVVTAADNAAWSASAYYSNRLIGQVEFGLTSDGTAQSYSIVTGNLGSFKTASKHKKLYGVLLAKAAFTPTAALKIIIKLGIIRN